MKAKGNGKVNTMKMADAISRTIKFTSSNNQLTFFLLISILFKSLSHKSTNEHHNMLLCVLYAVSLSQEFGDCIFKDNIFL